MRSYAAEECICVRLRMTGKPATNLREKIVVEKCPNLRAGHGTLKEKMVLKFDDAGNVMYKQLANNLMCKLLRNMNKK